MEISDVIREHWDRRANGFDEETGHGVAGEAEYRAWLALLERIAGPAPLRVLDVGCGTGFLALAFADLGHTATGVDFAPRMIERARRKAKRVDGEVEFFVADVTALGFPDATYDAVVARHVIWNLPDPERGLIEWLRVLRPGGKLALIEGKWANNEALAASYARPTSRLYAWSMRAGALLLSRINPSYSNQLLARRYARVEARLPFSGGLPAEQLVALLEASGVRDVVAEPLMDATLWGETPAFPRYLATGTRPR